MQIFSIDAEKQRAEWRAKWPYFLVIPFLISLLIFFVTNGFSLSPSRVGMQSFAVTTPLVVLLGLAVWTYQSFRASNEMEIEVGDFELVVTLPTRQIHFALTDFVSIKDKGDAIWMYAREGQVFCVPYTLQRYEDFKEIVKSWAPYEIITKNAAHFEMFSAILLVFLCLAGFGIYRLSSVDYVLVVSSVVFVVFGIVHFWLSRWSIPDETRRQVNRSVYGALGVVIVVMIVKALIL